MKLEQENIIDQKNKITPQISEHTMKHMYDVLLNHTLETYMILLTNVTPTNLILKKDLHKWKLDMTKCHRTSVEKTCTSE